MADSFSPRLPGACHDRCPGRGILALRPECPLPRHPPYPALYSANVGIYNVLYYTPIDLGTQISPFPLSTSIIYQYNEEKVVNFTKIVWNSVGGSGAVNVRFRVANSVADLSNATMSAFGTESPFDLSFGTDTFHVVQ